MNDNSEIPNVALRQHVTDHSFVLTLRKTHIHALIGFAQGDRSLVSVRVAGTPDFFVSAAKGLGRRGLVAHRHRPNFVGKMFGNDREPISNYYRLTRAGWAVFDLLVEAGLATAIDRRSSKRRLLG